MSYYFLSKQQLAVLLLLEENEIEDKSYKVEQCIGADQMFSNHGSLVFQADLKELCVKMVN